MPPLTEADEISNIAFGFMGSKALFVALDLGLFTALAGGALTAEEIGAKTGIHRDRAETLATADSGAHRILLSQMWTCREPRALVQSSGLCTMGCAVPLARPLTRAMTFTATTSPIR